jgi:hypothetical protein
VRLVASVLCAVRLSSLQSVSLMLPKSMSILMRKKSCAFFMLLGVFIFLMLVFYEFLGPNEHFVLKLGSDVHDSSVPCILSVSINHEY